MPDCRGYPGLCGIVRGCPGGTAVQISTDPYTASGQLAERIRGADTVLQFFAAPPLDTGALLAERPRRVVVAGPLGAAADPAALGRAGIEVYDTPGLAADSVAEFTLTLLLMLSRRVPAGVGAALDWRPSAGRETAGKLLGLVGWGRVGRRVAALARGIGMRVAAWSPHLDEEAAHAAGVRAMPLDALLAEADVVSLHLRAVPGAVPVLDARRLALLGPRTLLINTARAALVDMAELRRRLAADLLGGVALDVFDAEPLPAADPLRHHPRALVTPHMAWMTDEAVTRFVSDALAFATAPETATGFVRRVV